MAGNHTEIGLKQPTLQTLGDWIAPIIAFVSVSAMLLALASVLFESMR